MCTLIFAPFSDVLDTVTLLSERQHIAVLLGLVALWSLWRLAKTRDLRQSWRDSIRSFAVLLFVIAVVYVAAAYLPRPMAHLVSSNPDVLRIDFHSHTQSSPDARRTYSAERNRAWHHAAGYDVACVPWRMATERSANERRMWLVWVWVIAVVRIQGGRWLLPRSDDRSRDHQGRAESGGGRASAREGLIYSPLRPSQQEK